MKLRSSEAAADDVAQQGPQVLLDLGDQLTAGCDPARGCPGIDRHAANERELQVERGLHA